ncbi:hypothetical protein TeGR_g7401 [Tetraparma gracilis]|uniref:F-box domain-containing protein n=1 Tax=Tetraparma gracilis TaxID=2962635 RepID=A0ABQ6ML99_9STRA|nr:hypothetical protein TeGR_g7401 [Tetraparma gracilis]
MPLLSLPDDCLGEVCSFLSVRDLSLSWRGTCKVLGSVVRDAQVRESMVRAGSRVTTLGLAAEAERTAFGDLEALQQGREARPSPQRNLGEFKFLVALDVGRVWQRSVGMPRRRHQVPLPKLPGQAPPRLQFRECAATFEGDSLVLNGDLPTICSDDFEEELGGLHVAVVEKLTGKVQPLVVGPHPSEVDNDFCYYDMENFPNSNTLSAYDSQLAVELRVHRTDDGAENVSLHCTICGEHDISPAGNATFMRGIASMFT